MLDPILRTEIAGLSLSSPIGLAAGFDKHAEVYHTMAAFGFGFVEVGSITPHPQAGNPKPRLFRLTEDRAVINRMGFNSKGLGVALENLQSRGRSAIPLGINLGANKISADMAEDYVAGFRLLNRFADYITINLSSPNTPGLRALQQQEQMAALVNRIMSARREAGAAIPIFVKVAPDLTDGEIDNIAAVASQTGIQGLIISNTTIARPDTLRSRHRNEIGGLSGRPLTEMSLTVLRKFHRLTKGDLPLIGVGGNWHG